jgi:hypothetical protein
MFGYTAFGAKYAARAEELPQHVTLFAVLRRCFLLRCGVREHACTRPSDAPPLEAGGTVLPQQAKDPLYSTTLPDSRPVDWHSFRRATVTALRTSGANVQTAMSVTNHKDLGTHSKYDAEDATIAIPEAAQLGVTPGGFVIQPPVVAVRGRKGAPGVTKALASQYARSDSNGRHSASKADALSS